MIKAIETAYNGYRFRSRLEARWAVFFHALQVGYVYEPEGFDLGDGMFYLPDFWLPHYGMWAEVKATVLDQEEMEKASALALQSEHPMLLLAGVPENRPYDAIACVPLEDIAYLEAFLDPNFDNDGSPGTEAMVNWAKERLENPCYKVSYCLTKYNRYPGSDYEFYIAPSPGISFDDTRQAVLAARQARFEHGESPWTLQQRNASTIVVPG